LTPINAWGGGLCHELCGRYGEGILTDQNQPLPKPQKGLRRFQDTLRRNPVALIILVILVIGFIKLLSNLGSGPSSSGSVPSQTGESVSRTGTYKDGNAAINRGGEVSEMAKEGEAQRIERACAVDFARLCADKVAWPRIEDFQKRGRAYSCLQDYFPSGKLSQRCWDAM
jgi:hypothetical protein